MIGIGRRTLLALVASPGLARRRFARRTLLGTAPAAGSRIEPVAARQGMVVAQEARAARIGVEVLQKGGNAVDAAVATGFALAVTYPRAGNIGGGGYMVIHLADRNLQTAIDYRETAPAAITRDIFLDDRGEADPRKSRDSALAIGVPGTVAGLGACACEIRLGQAHARRPDRAGGPARTRRLSDRGRYRGLAAALCRAAGALAVLGENLPAGPTAARSGRARPWCRATSPTRSRRSRVTGRRRSTRVPLPTRSPPRCAPPAA